MCLAHNLFIRSLNAIYIQATSVSSPKDVADFLVYCQCWYEIIHHHHTAEEDFFFPEVEKALKRPGIMQTNIEQHKAFHDKLDAWAQRCYDLTADVSKYDGQEWRKMIEEWSVPFVKHLNEEITTLEELEPLDPENVISRKIWPGLEKVAHDGAEKVKLSSVWLLGQLLTSQCRREHFHWH